MSAFTEEGDLAQQVAVPEDPEESLCAVELASHLDGALMHQIYLTAGGITLTEDHIPSPERPDSYILDLRIHVCFLRRVDTQMAAVDPKPRVGSRDHSQNR
jgi:hypothetical protein